MWRPRPQARAQEPCAALPTPASIASLRDRPGLLLFLLLALGFLLFLLRAVGL
jgi:hypothetical protein